MLVGGRARKSLEPQSTPPWDATARPKIVSVNTDASFKVKDVGKINFFIYYFTRWTGDTSKHSLQSST